ncbi:kelch repeat protein [Cooperia oncophora]
MLAYRRHLGSAVLDGHLYVAGGYDGSSRLGSVEKYDPVINQWIAVTAMNITRYGVRLAAVNETLYAVGGNDDITDQETVEVFDIKSNLWTNHSCMNDA